MAKSQAAGYSREKWEEVTHNIPGRSHSKHPMIDTLLAEHRYMATVIQLLTKQLDALEQGEDLDPHVIYELMHYMCHYPDNFHHPREDVIYQRAGELDASVADSVDTLQRDHDYLAKLGDETLQAVQAWRDGSGKLKSVLGPAREYTGALYRHMSVEEKLVFPQLESLLTEEDWRELEQDDLLAPVEDPVFGPRVAREYRNLARKARRTLRRGVEDVAIAEWVGLETLLEGVEVFSMAFDSSSAAAREHFSAAIDETRKLVEEARNDSASVLLLPARCMANNTGRYFSWLRDMAGISRDTARDLASLNRDLRSNLRLMRGEPEKKNGAGRHTGSDHTVH
jgi:hemerythrin-like domain-containing protein